MSLNISYNYNIWNITILIYIILYCKFKYKCKENAKSGKKAETDNSALNSRFHF